MTTSTPISSAKALRISPPGTTSGGATTAQHDLILTHVESTQRVHVFHLERVPRDVDDALSLVVDEVMMRRELGIKYDLALGQHELTQQALLDE